MKSIFATSLCGIIALGALQTAQANLVQNGGFESTVIGPNSDTTYPSGQIGYNVQLTDWTSLGYNLLFAPGTADTPPTQGAQGSQGVAWLWGPNDGSANGLPAASPAGGNFVGGWAAFETGPLEQTINGLTIGQKYTLTFDWAGAQQYGFSGTNSESWQVSLGGATQDTPTVNNASHGFSGWMVDSMTFTATNTSEVLAFLAEGAPASGGPPVALLDNVDLEPNTPPPPVPDNGSTLLLLGAVGLGMVVLVPRFRRQY